MANAVHGDVVFGRDLGQRFVCLREQPDDTMSRMNDHEALDVWRLVTDARRHETRQTANNGQLPQFDQLISQLRRKTGFPALAEDDLRVGVALSWLGPLAAPCPPTALREEVLDLVRSEVPHEALRQSRITDIVIAYGCGNWRQPAPGGGSWEHRWPRALDWVAHHVRGWTKATAAWLLRCN